jgi:hypothetical protein
MDKNGMTAIKTNVNQRLIDVMSHSPNLTNIVVGRSRQFVMETDGPAFKGEIQYAAQLDNSAIDLYVYWSGNSTNSRITKIEAGIANSEVRTLWEQK